MNANNPGPQRAGLSVARTAVVGVEGESDPAADGRQLAHLRLGQGVEDETADFLDVAGCSGDDLGVAVGGEGGEGIATVGGIGRAAGASPDFQALQLRTYAIFTVIGVLAGAAGWAAIRARWANPRKLLRVLVPVVVLLSLVPDVLVGASGQMPGTSWGAVVGLMVMHLVVTIAAFTIVAVPAYQRVLPLPDDHR